MTGGVAVDSRSLLAGDADRLLDRGNPFQHQGAGPPGQAFGTGPGEGGGVDRVLVGLGGDQAAHRIIHADDLVQADPADIAGILAMGAALRPPDPRAGLDPR